jgi:hypothetical protein
MVNYKKRVNALLNRLHRNKCLYFENFGCDTYEDFIVYLFDYCDEFPSGIEHGCRRIPNTKKTYFIYYIEKKLYWLFCRNIKEFWALAHYIDLNEVDELTFYETPKKNKN